MEDNKQVRVNNWGVFFLQRLQLFFNKTDFCDLTLQFQGNVQLKVHRLVLNVCTEYFEILERSDRLIDDNVILMPEALQPDVVVPIINFMYTGMLEYPQSIYNRLCQAADLMRISVLTKLLDAQKPSLLINKTDRLPKIPKVKEMKPEIGLHTYTPAKKVTPKPIIPDHSSPTFPTKKLTGWKRKTSSISSFSSRSDSMHRSSDLSLDEAKPTRFEWPEDDLELPSLDNMDVSGFGDISYNSKPLLREDEVKPILEKSDTTIQTSNDTIHEIHLDDKSNHDTTRNGVEKRKADTLLDNKSPKRIRIVETDKDTTISVIANENTTNFDPTKIVSEILKKYPHLVKKKKNIKLKIVSKISDKDVSKTQNSSEKYSAEKTPVRTVVKKTSVPKPEPAKPTVKDSVWTCKECVSSKGEPMEFMLYYLYRKHMTDLHGMKFDPRICKYCGIAFSKNEQHSYHLFTKHGIKPLGGLVFPVCSFCPYVAMSKEALEVHESRHEKTEMQCSTCKLAFSTTDAMAGHLQITGHMGKSKKNVYDCQYCTKTSQSAISLMSHIKSNHAFEGKRDGIVSLDEIDLDEGDDILTENVEEEETVEEYVAAEAQKNKVKIISDVSVPSTKTKTTETVTIDQTKSHNSVPTSIATSLGLLDIVVLDENQQFILHNQAQQTGNNQTEYILPQINARNVTAEGLPSNDELVMVLTDQDYKDGHSGISTENSNIVVLYSHPADGQQGQFITSQGNLMVNSETGMLEIRNGAAIATTSASQIVVSTPTEHHIETIEMIQREIEGGQELKPEPYYDTEKPKEQAQEPVHYVENTQVEVQNEQVPQKEISENTEIHIEEVEKMEEKATDVTQEVSTQNPSVQDDSTKTQDPDVTPVDETEATHDAEQVEQMEHHEIAESLDASSKETVPMEIEETAHDEEAPLIIKDDIHVNEEIPQSDNTEKIIEETERKDKVATDDCQQPTNEALPQSSEGEKDIPMEIDESIIEHEEETTPQDSSIEENKDESIESNKLDNTTETETSEEKSSDLSTEKEEPEEDKPYSPTDNPVDMECEADKELSEKQDTDSLNETSIETSQCEKDDNQEALTSTQSSQITEDETDDKQSEGTKESTTMSILDDWEDTDSQQSDNKMKLIKKGAQETVHKLMDDWDEEEIEK